MVLLKDAHVFQSKHKIIKLKALAICKKLIDRILALRGFVQQNTVIE